MMQKELLKNFWTLPNCITWFRLIFGASITIWLYVNGYNYVWVVFLIFAATDCLDGWLSRRQKSGSSWGMILDPIADQCLVLPIIWAFYFTGRISYVAPVILTAREILMLLIRVFAKRDIPAKRLGKTKVVFEYIGVALLLVGGVWYYFGLIMFLPILFFAIISLLQYAYDVFVASRLTQLKTDI